MNIKVQIEVEPTDKYDTYKKTFMINIRSIFGKPRPYEKLRKEIEKLGTLTP